ncbi:MAG: glycosyltransferase [Candidatus Marsarchaeota archaeon]|nr:glycosyltransferase [Candidatus Marsarchaeota archaeon]
MKNKFFGDKFTLRIITVAIFIILALAGLGFSIYLFVIAKNMYMYVVATAFAALSVVSGFFNISASVLYYRSYFYGTYIDNIRKKLKPMKSFPNVGVAVPVYNEDPKVVEDTVVNLKRLDYPKSKIRYYLLDDSTEDSIKMEMKRIAKENNFKYIHRVDRKGFKAGALNNLARKMKEEYIAIFDYDERLTNPNFLKDIIPYFQDPNLSYVQTEKTHRKSNLFADSINIFDGFFFKFIEPARALNNTAIFAGSCGIIRLSALRDIGYFPEYVIEDTFFSFKSDLYNYKSLYVPKVYALGKPIKKFTELVKQQWRYNYGDTQFLKYFFKNRKDMKGSPISSMDYLTHGFGLNYISVILIMFTIVSIFIVFSAVPFVNLNVHQIFNVRYVGLDLEVFGSIALILSFLAPVIMTKIYFNSVKKGFMLFALNFALAFARTKAAIAAILKKNPGVHWNRNNESEGNKLVFSVMNTKTELAFATFIFALSFFAAKTNHISGGLWLMVYGFLYLFTTVFLYKYG